MDDGDGNFAMKMDTAVQTNPEMEPGDGNVAWKWTTTNEMLIISFKDQMRQHHKDEFIDFIDECHEYIEEKAG